MPTTKRIEKFSRPALSSKVESVGRPRTRKPKPGKPQQMSIALDGGLIARLDEALDSLNEDRRGPAWTRTDIVREAIVNWLDANASKPRAK
jgi:hypothetical protein